MKRAELERLAFEACNARTLKHALAVVRKWRKRQEYSEKSGSWYQSLLRVENLECSIFAVEGNVKLPFAAFSTLPQFTCPGAGDCLNFCYSYKAWRYASAFCRQLQNTLLMKFRHYAPIKAAIMDLKFGIDLRLYVDGDIDSMASMTFWFDMLRKRADLHAYGYSKSWKLFLSYHENGNIFPKNYVLNISSGSKYDANAKMRAKMLELPCTRGEFVGVIVDDAHKHAGFKRYESKEYHNDVRSKLRIMQDTPKVLSCPGQCGSCGNGRHWCGDMKLRGIAIGNGIH